MGSDAVVQVVPVRTKAQWNDFARLPFRIYGNDQLWNPEHPETLVAHLNQPGHRGDREFFLAIRDGVPVGRIAALVDDLFCEQRRSRTGIVGYFESENDGAVASALMRCAMEWLRSRNISEALGPCSLTLFESCGLLVTGSELPAVVGCAYTPPWYPALWESTNWTPAHRLRGYSLHLDRADEVILQFERIGQRLVERLGLTIVPIEGPDAGARLARWFGESESNPWSHLELSWPLLPQEIQHLGMLATTAGSGLHAIEVHDRHETPIGVAVFQDDTAELMRELFAGVSNMSMTIVERLKQVKTVRVHAYGFAPGFQSVGITAALPSLVAQLRSDYPSLEVLDFSWIDESNRPMIESIEAVVPTASREWVLYTQQVGES